MNLVVGLLVGNLAYLLGTIVLASFYDVTAAQLFLGPFFQTASSLVSAWVTIGTMLGVVDVLTVVGFVSTVTGGR